MKLEIVKVKKTDIKSFNGRDGKPVNAYKSWCEIKDVGFGCITTFTQSIKVLEGSILEDGINCKIEPKKIEYTDNNGNPVSYTEYKVTAIKNNNTYNKNGGGGFKQVKVSFDKLQELSNKCINISYIFATDNSNKVNDELKYKYFDTLFRTMSVSLDFDTLENKKNVNTNINDDVIPF